GVGVAKTGDKMNVSLNTILYGPPGTGKTYNSINYAVQIADPDFMSKIADIPSSRVAITNRYKELVNEGRIVFTTFHQSMSYEDFIEGIKPITTINEDVVYEISNGIFKQVCSKASKNLELPKTIRSKNAEYKITSLSEDTITIETTSGKLINIPKGLYVELNTAINSGKIAINDIIANRNIADTIESKYDKYYFGWGSVLYALCSSNLDEVNNNDPHVLIIDEINRGNISQIFGELITLIEPDKRAGNKEALEVTLPYSKERFSVPPNLYIIGTMNTADRSVEALDTALRRRFSFIEVAPDYNLLEDAFYEDISLSDLLETLNLRIEGLLDKDHAIGHSYFLRVANKEISLKQVFFNEIIPLLQEYFYGNYGRLELVLGTGFVKSRQITQDIFAQASYDNDDFADHLQFSIVKEAELGDIGFLNALHILLNNA
ncbi:MAG: AAA family ATPase, partial [Gammaproteobacteria bacterium]